MQHSVLLTDTRLTVGYPEGDVVTLYANQEYWEDAVDLLRNKDYEGIRELLNAPARKVLGYGNGHVTIDSGLILLDGEPVENVLVDRMFQFLDLGLDVEPLALFLVNLYKNPSYQSIQELYGFLEASDLTITSDGCFLAYKRVRDDYMDIYTGKMDNSIGTIVKMDRNQVDDNREQTCSNGLHICGRDYLSSYGAYGNGYRTVVVKVNPRDVVSIPTDYNNHKGRVCEYEVVGELEHSNEAPLEGIVTNDYDDWYPEDEMDENDDTARDYGATNYEFRSRAAAREYCSRNPAYVVRDRGVGEEHRWYVEIRKRR
jgi:hypothetical protein